LAMQVCHSHTLGYERFVASACLSWYLEATFLLVV
jgi:hypothetical protein